MTATALDPGKIAAAFPPDLDGGDLALEVNPNRIDYRPLLHQQRFHELAQPEKLALGGIGCGKSVMGVMEAVFRILLNQTRPHVGIVGAPTFPMLRDSVLPAWQRWLPAGLMRGGWEDAFNKSSMTLTLLGGRVVVLFRSLGERNYERARNVEIGWAGVEEASLLPTDDAWNVLLGRLRCPVVGPAIWAITSPRGENWVARKWLLEPSAQVGHVRARTYDNPHLPPGYIDRMRATYSERFCRQEIEGEIITPSGAVYERLERRHWPDGNVLIYEPLPQVPTRLAVDFGRRRPAVLAIQTVDAQHPATGRSYRLDVVVWELTGRDGRAPEDMTVDAWLPLVQAQGFANLKVIHGDPAGDSRNDQTHETSARKLVAALRVPFIPPSASWQRSKERGEEVVASRICSAAGERFLVWAARPEQDRLGRPILRAPNSYQSMERLQYPQAATARGQPVESLKDGINDHDADALRYDQVVTHGREGPDRPWAPRAVIR